VDEWKADEETRKGGVAVGDRSRRWTGRAQGAGPARLRALRALACCHTPRLCPTCLWAAPVARQGAGAGAVLPHTLGGAPALNQGPGACPFVAMRAHARGTGCSAPAAAAAAAAQSACAAAPPSGGRWGGPDRRATAGRSRGAPAPRRGRSGAGPSRWQPGRSAGEGGRGWGAGVAEVQRGDAPISSPPSGARGFVSRFAIP
jgi:hypothetical protein